VILLAGCPVDWAMEDGFLDRAAAKDIRENAKAEACPEGMHYGLPPGCSKKDPVDCREKCIADQ
jgi:hypothetical protein